MGRSTQPRIETFYQLSVNEQNTACAYERIACLLNYTTWIPDSFKQISNRKVDIFYTHENQRGVGQMEV